MRQSLREIFEDLENKDLQLTLAMQDLTIATGEINKAAEMRRKLDALSMYACSRVVFNGCLFAPIRCVFPPFKIICKKELMVSS